MFKKRKLFFFFNQLGIMLHSGISLANAIHSLAKRNTFSGRMKEDFQRLDRSLARGESLGDSLHRCPSIPLLYANMMRAAEISGRLPEIIENITDDLKLWIDFQLKLIGGSVYPLFLLHFAMIVPHTGLMITAGFSGFGQKVGFNFLALWLGAAILYLIHQILTKSKRLNKLFDDTLMILPYFSIATRDFNLYKFYLGFYYLYEAGHTMGRSFRESATLIGNHNLQARLRPILKRIQKDAPLVDAFKFNQIFPEEDVGLMITGEKTGRLDEQLKELTYIYKKRINRHATIITRIIISVIMSVIAGYVAFIVVQFWTNYYDQAFSQLDF